MNALELARMGANIRLEGRQAIVAGPRILSGAAVIASDLRDAQVVGILVVGDIAKGRGSALQDGGDR